MQQDDSHGGISNRLTRRAALQLGAGAGAAAAAAPYLARFSGGPRAFELGEARPALAQIPSWPVPPIFTRAQWGANEALRKPGQVYDATVAKLIVHHTGTPNDVTNYAGLCRSILANETSGEYIDIAYNWLIDPNGSIYEGRWARNYPAGAAHTGESLGANVRGAHAIYNNAHTIGVALMGTYDTINPPPAMVDALVTLLTWKCARWGIDPLGRGSFLATNGVVENIFNICGHRDTSATDCPGQRVEPMLPDIRVKVAGRLSGAGYWIATSVGQVLAFGGSPLTSAAGFHVGTPVSGIAGHPSGLGYWLFASDGSVYSFGRAAYHGSMRASRLSAPIVGMAPTPSGNGYWLVGRDGGIFSFGDARFFGSTGAMRLNAPVLGMTPTHSGRGYWLYASDGGIFTFGDAVFHGSTGGIRLNQPIVAMAARPTGDGYWMVARDGGVFSFGKAPFKGSAASARATAACVAMLPTTTGLGYLILRADGRLSPFGDAPDLGDAGGEVFGRAIGIAGKLKPFS
ncbi:MAG TPA: peptidoglycan recognition family protein [Acidimicrobiia bacterium]|nr:peptidoglycan recognition family protein [Acidimicrobiia bacterium]